MASMMQRWTAGMGRGAAVLICGTLLAVTPTMAQQEAGPPASPLTAQPQGPVPGGGMHGHMRQMMKDLNLTPEQQKTVRATMAEQRSKMKALRDDSSLQPAERRKQMRQLHQETMAKVRAVLNDDQKAQFDKQMAEMREHMREHRHGGAGQGSTPPAAPVPPQS